MKFVFTYKTLIKNYEQKYIKIKNRNGFLVLKVPCRTLKNTILKFLCKGRVKITKYFKDCENKEFFI